MFTKKISFEKRRIFAFEQNISESKKGKDITETPTLTKEEVDSYIDRMRLEALFNLFFTPIDTEKVFNDIYKRKVLSDETDLQPEDLEAERRLNNPEGNYYFRKPVTT